jgi:ADP-dependent NAD(P)H-hydrate dehydratase / NAD(P)H-hydrate epimerase
MPYILRSNDVKNLDTELERLNLLSVTVENAGRSVAEKTLELYPQMHSILVLAGKGFNGADALVAARHLIAAGRKVTVLHLENDWIKTVDMWLEPQDLLELVFDNLERCLPDAEIVLDGLLGTGFRAPLRENLEQTVKILNGSSVPILSIDLPSGLEADRTGAQTELFVWATHSLALGSLKPALLFEPTRSRVGQIHLLSIAVPDALLENYALAQTLEPNLIGSLLPVRSRAAHKGTAGEVWVLGGSSGMTGAPLMTAWAALKTGSGLVKTYSEVDLMGGALETIHHKVTDWAALETLKKPQAVAVGMGLGTEAVKVALQTLEWKIPTVLDADALSPALEGKGHECCIWTPHPKEAARMLGLETADIVRNPLESVFELQRRFGGSVVLKGGPTVVATPSSAGKSPQLWVNTGNPGMASAGMGDTLSGILASLLGQGLSGPDAARAGVFLHGWAADSLLEAEGYGLQASEVAARIGRTMWHLMDISRESPQSVKINQRGNL